MFLLIFIKEDSLTIVSLSSCSKCFNSIKSFYEKQNNYVIETWKWDPLSVYCFKEPNLLFSYFCFFFSYFIAYYLIV